MSYRIHFIRLVCGEGDEGHQDIELPRQRASFGGGNGRLANDGQQFFEPVIGSGLVKLIDRHVMAGKRNVTVGRPTASPKGQPLPRVFAPRQINLQAIHRNDQVPMAIRGPEHRARPVADATVILLRRDRAHNMHGIVRMLMRVPSRPSMRMQANKLVLFHRRRPIKARVRPCRKTVRILAVSNVLDSEEKRQTIGAGLGIDLGWLPED